MTRSPQKKDVPELIKVCIHIICPNYFEVKINRIVIWSELANKQRRSQCIDIQLLKASIYLDKENSDDLDLAGLLILHSNE